MPPPDVSSLISKARRGGVLDADEAARLAEAPPEAGDDLLEAASHLRDRGHGRVLSYAKNIFIPLTNLCRDVCGYCTFAKQPDDPAAKTYTPDEVRAASREGRRMGCREALFCLGDKPELVYGGYRKRLRDLGHETTASYLTEACAIALEEGIFPHTNAGILTRDEMARLRPLNHSMGLMLESASARLMEPGMPHHACPDKVPRLRLRMMAEAGELRIPFTTGILIGIGETPRERAESLLAIRALREKHGHIQEVIIQNFLPKAGTGMAARAEAGDALEVRTVALARLVLGADCHIQAPPNLNPRALARLIAAGVDDWGGVSPATVDFVNPEAPWPALARLAALTAGAGYTLRERLAVYPEYLLERREFIDPDLLERTLPCLDADGFARPADGPPGR
ncbi:MAG: 7,8-didemethyl-8-hydroxy-5-deazariboflavin synthase CofG [Myxococcota bacterium]